MSSCRDKGWSFERVPNAILQGHDDRRFDNVPGRRDCEELCLRERGFRCRSAEYDSVALTCALSRESRRTRPGEIRDARNVDYLENACIKTSESPAGGAWGFGALDVDVLVGLTALVFSFRASLDVDVLVGLTALVFSFRAS